MIRIRLQRRGRRKRPIYHIVVADSRAPRDGRIIEDLGRFDNVTPRNQVDLNQDRAIYWIQKGAQPSDTVRSILKEQGILYRVHLMKWGKSEEEIEQALAEWREGREARKDEVPTRKERQRALLEAEENEYQKQLKKKAEEAARQKAKEEALAAEEDTAAEESEPEEAGEASEPEVQKEAKKEAADEGAVETESSDEEQEKTEAVEEEAGTASEPEVLKEAEKQATEADAEPAEDEAKKDSKNDSSGDSEAEKNEENSDSTSASGSQLSTDMTAKDAIDHINNTDIDDLQGFVPDDEDRVTVQRAWESKQEG